MHPRPSKPKKRLPNKTIGVEACEWERIGELRLASTNEYAIVGQNLGGWRRNQSVCIRASKGPDVNHFVAMVLGFGRCFLDGCCCYSHHSGKHYDPHRRVILRNFIASLRRSWRFAWPMGRTAAKRLQGWRRDSPESHAAVNRSFAPKFLKKKDSAFHGVKWCSEDGEVPQVISRC